MDRQGGPKAFSCSQNEGSSSIAGPRSLYNCRMAEPARHTPASEVLPPVDPAPAVDRAYHFHRARRRARVERKRDVRRAGLRFWIFLFLLLALALFLALTVWHQLQRLFGL